MNESTGRARPGLRTRVVVAVATGLALTSCAGVGTSSAQLDARFVDAVRSDGHAVAQDDSGATLALAARKICERRDSHASDVERRRSALTHRELEVVTRTFVGDAQRFAALALETYCPS